MEFKEKYVPSPEEMRKAESMLTEEKRVQTEIREDAMFEGKKRAQEKGGNIEVKENAEKVKLEDEERIAEVRKKITEPEQGSPENNHDNKIESDEVKNDKLNHKAQPRPVDYFLSAMTDKDELHRNGGLYKSEKGELSANLPWNKRMMRGILEKLSSVNPNMAKALDLLWENGNTHSPIMERDYKKYGLGMFANERIDRFNYGKVSGSMAVSVDFLRGGEYKSEMQECINNSFRRKEERDAEKAYSGLKKSLIAGTGVGVFAGMSVYVFYGGLALQAVASGGFILAGTLPMTGVGAWRLYKHFRNKNMAKKQLKALENL